MDKNLLRKELKEKRNLISQKDKGNFDTLISEKIISLKEFKVAKNILLFSPLNNEFNTEILFNKAKIMGKNIFYPRCTDKNGNMEFFKISYFEDFEKGSYGILEPKEFLPKYIKCKNSVCIIPALSVDKNYYRIGYGKGYYDRFLKDFTGVKICPCYDLLLSESLPHNNFDVMVDIIITEKDIMRR